MKIRIDEDEYFPFHFLVDAERNYGREVDVPAETVERWERVHREFEAVQDEMQAAFKGGR